MTIPNPTRIKIGDALEIAGVRYFVQGRAVLGVLDGGCFYYWHEFNLEDRAGRENATLVFEDGAWRLFKLIEPSLIDAASVAFLRRGDPVDLGGTFFVTRVDKSRVYHTEGKNAEGVRAGAEANYINARSGELLAVVSWTGEEVEYYRGRNISAGMVARALGLRGPKAFLFIFSNGARGNWRLLWFLLIPALIAGLVALCVVATRRPQRPPAVVRKAAPAAVLKVGDTGMFHNTQYHVVGNALMEVAEQGRLSGSREYSLRDDQGNPALLVEQAGAESLVFTEIEPPPAMTPYEAARVGVGERVKLGGLTVDVRRLSRFTTRHTEAGDDSKPGEGEVFYTFSGEAGTNSVLVRWNGRGIKFYQGQHLPWTTHLEPRK